VGGIGTKAANIPLPRASIYSQREETRNHSVKKEGTGDRNVRRAGRADLLYVLKERGVKGAGYAQNAHCASRRRADW